MQSLVKHVKTFIELRMPSVEAPAFIIIDKIFLFFSFFSLLPIFVLQKKDPPPKKTHTHKIK